MVSYPHGGFAALQSAGVSTEQQLRLLNGLGPGGASPKVGAMGEGGRRAVMSKRGVHSSRPKSCASESSLIGGRERPIGSQVVPGLCLVCISLPVEGIKTALIHPGRWLLMRSAHDSLSLADAASESRNPWPREPSGLDCVPPVGILPLAQSRSHPCTDNFPPARFVFAEPSFILWRRCLPHIGISRQHED